MVFNEKPGTKAEILYKAWRGSDRKGRGYVLRKMTGWKR